MVLSDDCCTPNHRAIFASCLDSQLRFVSQVIAGLPLFRYIVVDRASLRPAMRVRWAQGGHSSPRVNKMRKPTSCINEREHPARFRVWMKNGDPQSVSSTFTCFVRLIDWDRRWRKFENGDEPICVCEDAAREMGIVW
jgi:hypothetical protein